jgi:glycosyltransferase involved in cell wall biosynthesis
LPEVTGDAAIHIDPHDTHALANAISLLLGDEQLRESLRQKGYIQAQKYTWSGSAHKTLSLYQKLYTGVTNFSEETEMNSVSLTP